MPQPESRPSLVGALAILVIGLVILVPSGLSTKKNILSALVQIVVNHRFDTTQLMILASLAVGGPFILAGGALVSAGVRKMRARRDLPDE